MKSVMGDDMRGDTDPHNYKQAALSSYREVLNRQNFIILIWNIYTFIQQRHFWDNVILTLPFGNVLLLHPTTNERQNPDIKS